MAARHLRTRGALLVTPVSRPFDEDFRRLVVPQVVRAIQIEAALAGFELKTFDQATGDVMWFACGHGAGYLSSAELDNLYDWVIEQLADCLEVELGP